MDLIDREALYKEICRVYEYEYPTASGAFDEFVSRTLKNIIYNAPTVEAEPVRHGKWITKDVGFLQKSFICSACGGWEHNLECEHEDLNYCPHCGAKMED